MHSLMSPFGNSVPESLRRSVESLDMWNTHFGRAWMWDHLFLYARISCMVLTSSFGIIHANGLHHSLELSALTGESPCSQRKVCTISRVAFPSSNRHLEESTGPPEVH